MNININENIKKLRREKNITQEKLAEYLNVSTQAVSKWERNETLPDITMIIPIASYFNVSTDELLGVDAAKNEAKIQEYRKEKEKLIIQGKWPEASELMTKAHKEFPNDFRITYYYMSLIIARTGTSADIILSHADEFTVLCERILDECTIDDIRSESIHILAQIKRAQGKVDEALELLNRFPDWYRTRNQFGEQLFDKKTEEWTRRVNDNFWELAGFAHNKLLKIIWYSDKQFDEKLKISNKIIEYLLKISEETNRERLYGFISSTYSEIGRQCHIEGRSDDVAKYWDIASDYSTKINDFNTIKLRLAWYENNPWFEELRKTESFNAMLEKYRPFAKNID
jgi:transcriptional regulator with XRE-family HTH domain